MNRQSLRESLDRSTSVGHVHQAIISLSRLVIGMLFCFHGAASLFGLFGGAKGSGRGVEFATWPGWWAAAIEFVGGFLVLLGLCTRSAAIICSGTMAYAYFVVHQPGALLPLNNGGEPAALFCWTFLLIAAVGPGGWSIDALLASRADRLAPPVGASAISDDR